MLSISTTHAGVVLMPRVSISARDCILNTSQAMDAAENRQAQSAFGSVVTGRHQQKYSPFAKG